MSSRITRQRLEAEVKIRKAAETRDPELALEAARLITELDFDLKPNPWNRLAEMEPRLQTLLDDTRMSRVNDTVALTTYLEECLKPLVGPHAENRDPLLTSNEAFDAALSTLYLAAAGWD
jgi:hypothetical protein